MSDNVKHPSHYCKDGIECIDAIKAIVSTIADPFEAYCTGNIVKYVWRWNSKNGIEDLHKAIQYIDFIEQYRGAKFKTQTPTTDNPAELTQEIKEEMFAEVKPSKYDGMTDDDLKEAVCKKIHSYYCKIGECPLVVMRGGIMLTCTPFFANYPEEARATATEWLKAHDKKGGEK